MSDPLHDKTSPATPETSAGHVSGRQRLAWGVGSIAEQSMLGINGLMDQVFIIGLGLNAGLIGVARSMPRFFDMVSDPLIGYLSDNTRSRWGRRKPWMLAGLIICIIALIVMWHPPMIFGEKTACAYIGIMNVLLYGIGFALFTIPYLGMGFELSSDYNERTHIMQWRQYALAVTGFLSPWFVPLILNIEGVNATTWKGTHGILWVSIGVAALVLVTGLMPILFCKEKVHTQREGKVNFLQAVRYTMTNRAFWPLLLSNFMKRLGINITGIFFFYVIIYGTCKGDNAAGATWYAVFCNVINVATFIGMYPVVKLTDRLGKKKALILLMLLSAVTYASVWWTMRPGWVAGLVLTAIGIGIFCNSMPMIVNSMLADVCDEDELKCGHRREAFYGSVFVTTDKIAIALTTLAQGWLLVASHFNPKLTAQTAETVATWMKWLIMTQPTGFVLGAVFICFYPITRQRAQNTRDILNSKKQP